MYWICYLLFCKLELSLTLRFYESLREILFVIFTKEVSLLKDKLVYTWEIQYRQKVLAPYPHALCNSCILKYQQPSLFHRLVLKSRSLKPIQNQKDIKFYSFLSIQQQNYQVLHLYVYSLFHAKPITYQYIAVRSWVQFSMKISKYSWIFSYLRDLAQLTT